jgi:AcrR family transcriptional regulator
MRANVRFLREEKMEELSNTESQPGGEAMDGELLSRAERRDQQIQRILEAAKTCFVRSGFQGASMQQICAEVGMSPGALYRYFPSKEAIVEAICEADRQDDMTCFGALRDATSAIDGLVAGAMAHITHTSMKGSAPLFAEMRSESMRNEAIRATVDGHKSEIAAMIEPLLAAAIERGEVNPPVELPILMAVLMSIGEGMAINDLPARGVPLDKLEIVLRAMIEGMLRPTKSTAAAG